MMKKRRFNWVVSDGIRKWFKFYYETSARLRGQAFYCSALHGSRITTSPSIPPHGVMHCQDYDGSGHIGDLKTDSFEKVFHGPVAQDFRASLARGKMPIMTCARCGDLRRIAKSKIPKDFPNGAKGQGSEAGVRSAVQSGDLPRWRLPYEGCCWKTR